MSERTFYPFAPAKNHYANDNGKKRKNNNKKEKLVQRDDDEEEEEAAEKSIHNTDMRQMKEEGKERERERAKQPNCMIFADLTGKRK